MNRVLTAVILIPIVLLIVLRAPLPVLAGVVAVVAVLGARELFGLAEHYGVQPIRLPAYAYIALILAFVAAALSAQTQVLDIAGTMLTLLAAVLIAPFLFLIIGMRRAQLATALPAAATVVVALTYIALPLAVLVVVRSLWAGGFLLLYLLLVVWAGDIFAYYTGRLIGRHKLAPRVSPGKTWEGAIASLVGSLAVGWAVLSHARVISEALLAAGVAARSSLYLAPEPLPMRDTVILSAVINVAAQVGDLTESLIKRGAGVKDSGTLLPGHGGILDRIDALLFAAPVLWYYAAWRVMS